MYGLNKDEISQLRKLSNPRKIQDFLDTLPINFEKTGETYMSPRRTLREKKAHCLEGALVAAVTFWIHGGKPLLMDFRTADDDEDHVVAPFTENGYWGAISKTNHAILRYRDPVYASYRELAMSYFHEYFMFENGRKTLVSYSKPLNLKTFGTAWVTAEEELDEIALALDEAPHVAAVPRANRSRIRLASQIELEAGKLTEWSKDDPRT
ncbi:MAG: hypothetical protein RIQ56_649 [Candidatus Parcubacteria bacterium]|jgi:hypothetical protein